MSRICRPSIALRRIAILVAILVAIGGCFDLPDIKRDVCGNGIVEADEDCDRFPDPAHIDEPGAMLTCSASCRYACVASDAHPACPAGWGCGLDGVCRHGDAEFSIDGPIALPSAKLFGAPLDGDGRTQVIGTGGSTVGVLRADPYPVSLLRVAEPATCAARAVNGRASLLASTGTAIVGWNTTPDGFQAMLAIERTPDSLVAELGTRVLALRTGQSPAHPVAFFALQSAAGLRIGTLSPPLTTVLPAVTGALTQLVAHPAIGNIDGNAGDELALSFLGGTTAWVIGMASTTCTGSCSSCVGARCELDTPSVIATITAPGPIGDRLVFGDVDNDGKPDLLIKLDDGRVAVARGNGIGGFAAAAIDARFATATVTACAGASFGNAVGSAPLLARDLDGDGLTDYATTTGVILGRPGGNYCRAAFAFAGKAAASLDVNGDGRTDVALVDGGVVLVETRAPSGAFDAHAIDLPGGVSATDVDIADVDGDYLDDVIIRAVDAQGEPELWISHGSPAVTGAVTPGPEIGAAISYAVGAFEQLTGSAGGIVIYGYDALTDHDFTARLEPTIGGLGSDFVFDSPERAFDVQLGHFLAGGRANTLDLLVARGTVVEVSPDQTDVLRRSTKTSGTFPDAFRTSLRIYGDMDGDGLDEACYFDDQAAQTFLVCRNVGMPPMAPIAVGAVHRPRSGQIVDLDGDGGIDLVAAFEDGGVVVVHDLARPEVVSAAQSFGAIGANIDDDPALEIVAIQQSQIHFYKGTTEIGALDQPSFTGAFTGALASADLDGNGVNDIVVGHEGDIVFVLVPQTNTGIR